MNGLRWWQWTRATTRLEQWVRTLIGGRPYAIAFQTGEGSYVDFSRRVIVIEPNLPDHLSNGAAEVPTLWGRSRVVRVSTLQVLCARALAYHEGGHVLFTDVVEPAGSTHAWLCNALEDERIERLTAGYYRPAGRDFREIGRRMWRDGVQPSTDRATILLNACLFHRWDHERAPDAASRLTIPDDDESLWQEQIRPLVEAAWAAPHTGRVAEIACEILTLIGIPHADEAERRTELQRGNVAQDRITVGTRSPDDPPLHSTGTRPPAVIDEPGEDAPEPDAENSSLASAGADVDPSDGRLWLQPYQELQQIVIGDVRRLTRELAIATPDVEPVANSKRGRLDVRACVRSHGKTPVVRDAEEADDPRGLAIVLLIDGTASMGGDPRGVAEGGGPSDPGAFNDLDYRMPHVRKAGLAFQRACADLGVPLEIGVACDEIRPSHNGRGRYRVTYPIAWIQRWDTPVHAEGPRALIAGLYGNAYAEAVTRSLMIAQHELDQRSEAVKVVLYIHDGQPTDEPRASVRATVEHLRRRKTIVIGLFLGDQSYIELMQGIFGVEWTIGTDRLVDLPARLGRILKRLRTTR